MKMLVNRKGLFTASGSPISSRDTMNSSFSDCSWDSSTVHTPTSSIGMSFDTVKVEDGSFTALTPSRTDGYGNGHNFMDMASITQDMGSSFQDPTMMFTPDSSKMFLGQDPMGFNNFNSFNRSTCDTSNVLPNTSMDIHSYSPTSTAGHASVECIAPSQTTFLDAFEMQSSPTRPVNSLHFDLQYDSSASEYATDYSFGPSPSNSFNSLDSSFSDSSSTSNTPCRPSAVRQLFNQSLQSSAALHRVQQSSSVETGAQHSARQSRRRTKREYGYNQKSIIDNNHVINYRVEKEAKKKCDFEGCNGKFKRQEHLKRHLKTVHLLDDSDYFNCPFFLEVGCIKRFSRGDNFKDHIKLHTHQHKKASRTKYVPGAFAFWEQLCRQSGKPKVQE